MTALCRKVDMTRQNFYKERKVRMRREVDEGLIGELVKFERQSQPQMGGLKLYCELKERLEAEGVRIGRDCFMEVLRKHGLLLERKRRTGPRTTDSRHCLPVYPNLLKDRALTGPDQAWVTDITYIRTAEGFLYLALMMDAFSRKIVGFHVGDSLEVTGCLTALKMAIAQLPRGAAPPIHHSDRGSQYCSRVYTKLLADNAIRISMTEHNHCYENAMAERLNGILKQEYYLGEEFLTKADGIRAVRQAVELYNTRRRHRSLGMRKPQEVHQKKVA